MCSWFLKSTTSMKVMTPFSWGWRGVVAEAAALLADAAGRLPAAFFDGPEFASAADLRFMSGPEDDDAAAVEPVARPLEEAEGGIGG